jgi:hypothetical protein
LIRWRTDDFFFQYPLPTRGQRPRFRGQVSQSASHFALVGENPQTPVSTLTLNLRSRAMRKRTSKVTFRVTENEYFELHRKARVAGFSMESYIRHCCFVKDKIIVIDGELVRSVYKELNMTGSNVNQIARIANSNKSISKGMVHHVISLMDLLITKIDESIGGIKR